MQTLRSVLAVHFDLSCSCVTATIANPLYWIRASSQMVGGVFYHDTKKIYGTVKLSERLREPGKAKRKIIENETFSFTGRVICSPVNYHR